MLIVAYLLAGAGAATAAASAQRERDWFFVGIVALIYVGWPFLVTFLLVRHLDRAS